MNIEELQRWFTLNVTRSDNNGKRVEYGLDDEQARVVLDEHDNLIVTAMAGSGKTYTLIAKIIYLLCIKGVNPEQILALGFNNKPQKDFRRRLTDIRVNEKQIITPEMSENMARTFHSFACDISKLEGREILFDNKEKREKAARSKYIAEIVEKVVDGKAIYDFIRDDSYEPKREDYKNDKDYYSATKYQCFDTLSGDMVRSRGEKIIADFLFEHGIEFIYEQVYYPNSLIKYSKGSGANERLAQHEKIISDFYLTDYDIVWEHWGITGNESPQEVQQINASGAVGKYEEYEEKKEFKEWFYSGEWLNREALNRNMKHSKALDNFLKIKGQIYTNFKRGISREQFEHELKEQLESMHIHCNKLSEDELIEKFRRAGGIRKNNKRVESFIDRAEQQFPGDYKGLYEACKQEMEQQTKLFYKVALTAYNYYLTDIQSEADDSGSPRLIDKLYAPETIYGDDYPLLMHRAAGDIAKRRERSNAKIKIDTLRYIFLDEYQDFSLLFFNLIKAIRERVANVRVLAVGDDCQAINSYTGASLEYFDNFEKYFPENVARLTLSTNYRSVFSIVETANTFLENSLNHELKAKAKKSDNKTDHLKQCVIEKIRKFYPDENHEYAQDYRRRYTLLLSEIAKDNPGKTIKCLNRKGKISFEKYDKEKLVNFEKEFKNLMRKEKIPCDKINFSTVHTAKGLEADVVVLLESDVGKFPSFHPDNHLYKVFGDSIQKELDDQKRLFYVAITRPKEKLYIVHDFDKPHYDNGDKQEQNERDFLDMIGIDKISHYQKKNFIPLQTLVENGDEKFLTAIKIEEANNRYEPKNIDITVTAKDGQKVVRRNAFRNDSSACQMRNLAKRCSKERPASIKVVLDNRYQKRYFKLYDTARTV